MSRIKTGGVIVVALSVVLAGCKAGAPPSSQAGGMPPTAVETTVLKAQPLAQELTAVGSLRAEEAAMIRPEIAGKIERIHFREGQSVQAGDLLFSLDASLVRADANEARANLDNSRRALSRAKDLDAKQLVSRADLDTSRAREAVDAARLASAQARLEKSAIRAPFSGVVGLNEVSVGDYVSEGQAMVNLVKLDPMQVEFRVPEADLGMLAVNQTVAVTLAAFPGKSFAGAVFAIDPMVDAEGRNLRVRARLNNPERKLRPGLFAQVRIVTGDVRPVLMVPEQALWPEGERVTVFRVEQGIAHQVVVQVGRRLPGQAEIVSGLKSGDQVVLAGQLNLHDGSAVAPIAPTAAKP